MIAAAFLMIFGATLVGIFAHLNLNVQPRIFPNEVLSRNGVITRGQTHKISRMTFGLFIAVLFFAGIALFSLGSAIIATTLGYGHG